MKQSEIELGTEYMVSTTTDLNHYSNPIRAKALRFEKLESKSYSYRGPKEGEVWYPGAKGHGAFASSPRGKLMCIMEVEYIPYLAQGKNREPVKEERAVSAQYIRSTWAEWEKRKSEMTAAAERASINRQRAYAEKTAELEAAKDRLSALGIEFGYGDKKIRVNSVSHDGSGGEFVLSPPQMQMLLDAAESRVTA